MNKFFYLRLAATNLKKNRQTYLPYLLTCIGTICMYYIFQVLLLDEGLSQFPGGKDLRMMLALGMGIIAIFSAVFLFYTNSFLIKQRKKELGLYCILGLEKKHVCRMMFYENLILYVCGMLFGVGAGIIFGKLVFWLLLKMVNFNVVLTFHLHGEALTRSATLFLAIFALNLATNILHVRMVNPIDLLKGQSKGEKEPKSPWVLALLGFLCLGTGYYIAVVTKSPLEALTIFFLAVLLVIAGTFLLFTAGSITILKMLKRSKRFYYKPNNFISISGMIYRMKQNAAGLANICILSTMVIIMLGGTLALYIGQEKTIRNRFPFDLSITSSATPDRELGIIEPILAETAAFHNITTQEQYTYRYLASYSGYFEDNRFLLYNAEDDNPMDYEGCTLTFIPLEDYNRIERTNKTVAEDEILFFQVREDISDDELIIGDHHLKIKEKIEESSLWNKDANSLFPEYYLVVKDMAIADQLYQELGEREDYHVWKQKWMCNIDGEEEDCVAFGYEFRQRVQTETPFTYVDSLHTSLAGWYATYGGFLFIGIFLGLLFLMATVLIIYFKQVSEGYDDHDRYLIMKKVGMGQDEVKRSIQKQVFMVFFLPLLVALVHTAFAFPLITRLLAIMNLNDVNLEILCMGVVVVLFAIVYTGVYVWTARVYYKLVK